MLHPVEIGSVKPSGCVSLASERPQLALSLDGRRSPLRSSRPDVAAQYPRNTEKRRGVLCLVHVYTILPSDLKTALEFLIPSIQHHTDDPRSILLQYNSSSRTSDQFDLPFESITTFKRHVFVNSSELISQNGYHKISCGLRSLLFHKNEMHTREASMPKMSGAWKGLQLQQISESRETASVKQEAQSQGYGSRASTTKSAIH